jgi:hypothetical protein
LLERKGKSKSKEKGIDREREREREKEERVNKIIHIMGNYIRRTRGVKLLF